MHKAILVFLVVLSVPPLAAEEVFYIDSHGRRVDLTLAPDKLAVEPAPGALEELASRKELDLTEDLITGPHGLLQIPVKQGYYHRQAELADELVQTGLARRAGRVFVLPDGSATFSLHRQVIVKLRAGQADDLSLKEAGLEPLGMLGARGDLLLCRAEDAEAALKASIRASGISRVKWAIPDFTIPIELYHRPNDPYFGNQWHHQQESGAHIGSEAAWDITLGDNQVVVAVIDTGVDEDHPDLDAANIVTGYNAVDDSNDPTPLTGAVDAHGTACSGEILAAADNDEGVVGVCPACSLMGIKMMDGASTQAQISQGYIAIEYAVDNGAWVISNSWGIDEGIIGQVDIQPFYDAIQDAVSLGRGGKGAVVLFASGNGNQWTGEAEPIGTHELQNQAYVMAVGGTDYEDQVVGYSDYGPNLSVVAPTGAINVSNPEQMFDGPQIVTTDTPGEAGFSRGGYYYTVGLWGDQKTDFEELDATGNYTSYFNGTSAACPIAAGVVALVFSANPDLTGAEARLIVEQTAEKVGGDIYDSNGHDDHYGYGRVNLDLAVLVASLGLGNSDGSDCAHALNCEGSCHKTDPGNDLGLCITPCEGNDDCGESEVCVDIGDGTLACMPSCTGDDDCSPPALCLPSEGGGFLCQAIQCEDGSDCPEGTACPPGGGICARTCDADGDCDGFELCLPADGGDMCQAVECEGDQDCPDGTECGEDGYCIRETTQPDGGQDDGGQGDGGGEENNGGGGCGCHAAGGDANPGLAGHGKRASPVLVVLFVLVVASWRRKVHGT